jgi:SAM-dependent methyltransferase
MPFENVSIVRVRDYWNARPCNVRHSLAPIGTKEYFDQVETRKYLVEPHIPKFAEFPRWRDKRVLEVGCGIGTDTINFARAGATVTAVDLSDESLSIARQRARVFDLQDRITFLLGNAEELTSIVPVEPFDLIYSFGVIHHTPHPERVLQQLRHYARVGTTLKVMVYHKRSYKVAWIMFTEGKGRFWQLDEVVAKNSEAQTGCPVTYTYTRKTGGSLLNRNGFQLRNAEVDHIFPFRIADYIQYKYVKEWYFRHLPDPVFCALERRFGWHLLLTAEAV